MNPTAARQELLAQHQRLRGLLADVEELAKGLLGGAPVGPAFSAALALLRTELESHNTAEEAALVPLLRAGDAWGGRRVERMFEEHAAEHAAMRGALTGPDHEVAGRMGELGETLRAHIEAEERTILHPRVLR